MNKILWFITFWVYFLILIDNTSPTTAYAASYDSFAEIYPESGKLLSNYTDLDYEKYYPMIDRRVCIGWNTYIVNKEVKTTFIEKTLLEVVNEKNSAVDYKYTATNSNEARTILDASGSIGFDIKGDIKKFKNNLNGKINIGYKEEHTNVKKKTEEIKISCEAHTKLLITQKGYGVLTNGVAAYYLAWIRLEKGGFEYFTITDEFQSIEKVAYEKV